MIIELRELITDVDAELEAYELQLIALRLAEGDGPSEGVK